MNFDKEKPVFVNSEGFGWYLDKEHQKFAQQPSSLERNNGLTNIGCFIVKKQENINYVMIDNNQNIIAESHFGKEWSSDTWKTRITALKILQNYEK